MSGYSAFQDEAGIEQGGTGQAQLYAGGSQTDFIYQTGEGISGAGCAQKVEFNHIYFVAVHNHHMRAEVSGLRRGQILETAD